MNSCPDQTDGAPAKLGVEPGRQWPADGAGEAGDERDPGDRRPGSGAINPHQRGKRHFVEARAHCHADQHPCREEAHRALRGRQRDQPRGEHAAGARQHDAPAVAVDQPTGEWTHDRGCQQCGRKGEEYRRSSDTERTRHPHGKDGGQVIARRIGDGHRHAQLADRGTTAVQSMPASRFIFFKSSSVGKWQGDRNNSIIIVLSNDG